MIVQSKYIKFFYSKLPVIVRNDIEYQVKRRKERAGANITNLVRFKEKCVDNGLKRAPFIENKFQFADMRKGAKKAPAMGLDHHILMDDSAIESLAKNIADMNCSFVNSNDAINAGSYLESLQFIFLKFSDSLRSVFINPPSIKKKHETIEDAERELEIAIKRCMCEKWIVKRFFFLRTQYVEYAQIALGRVGKKKNQKKYVSAVSFSAWKRKQKEAADFLDSMAVYCEETGESFDLSEVAKRTTANPENRRIEMMVRSRGNEERAIDLGYVGIFVTWTLPSKYHPSSKKWNGSTIKEGHKVNMAAWARARARIAKSEIDYFGFRVAEPHKDGCEHLHMFLFCSEEDKDELIRHMQEVACEEDIDELVDDISPRFKVKLCDPAKGGFTAYIAKYIAKNINGAYMPGSDAEESAWRVRAWASTHRIRQFQAFGSSPVGLWRQLRRTNEADTRFCEKLDAVRCAADSSKWKVFCELAQPAQILYEKSEGVYGEETRKVIGFSWLGRRVLTSAKKFAIVTKSKVAALLSSGSAFWGQDGTSWSTENNCNSELELALKRLSGWSKRGVQCLIGPLLEGKLVWIDEFCGLKLVYGELRVKQREGP